MSSDPWRISRLEHNVEELDDVVRGNDPWSHERRLAVLENERIASQLVKDALNAYRKERERFSTRVREWGSFALAVVAIAVAIVSHH